MLGYRTEVIRLDSGERFPLLIDRTTGLPDPHVLRFSLAYHRPKSVNTAKSQIMAIALFKEWLDERRIDLEMRVGSGDLFTADEIEALSTVLRRSKSRTIQLGNETVAGVVIGDTHVNRTASVIAYLRWRVSHVVQAMRASDPRVSVVNSRIAHIQDQLSNLAAPGGAGRRFGLTETQQIRLFEIARPDSPLNPFHPETRYRNFVLILSYYELGLRRGEPLILKGQHLLLHDQKMPRLIIEPNPDDPEDKRHKPPLVKTAGRVLPVSAILAQSLHTYVVDHRSKVPGAKRNPFIFLASDSGNALSLDAVYDIFVVIRENYPADFPADLAPHILRHTWNDRFRRKAKSLGLLESRVTQLGNYVMGWSKASNQASNYGLLETQNQAEEILLALQAQMMRMLS